MKKLFPRFGLGCAIVLTFLAATSVNAQLQRAPNTTLQLPPSPPIVGYTSSNAFPGLSFTNPVAMVTPPDETNRLFVVGKNGFIYVITNLAAPTESIFMDISNRVTSTGSNSGNTGEQGLLSLAFDPGYATNHYFYVVYDGQATNGVTGLHWILSRFQCVAGNTNKGDPNSETFIINQYKRAPNHNGGDIEFGPDGYLYVSVGDEGNEHDTLTNSQHITWRLWSGILRIDVDKIDPLGLYANSNSDLSQIYSKTTNYFIPHDNPFIGATTFDGQSINPNNVQTEFWAVGLRNPWRISFDPATGELYAGCVGQDAGSGWEEINLITKGANYGWSFIMGTNTPGPRASDAPGGFSRTLPLYAYQTSASAATGRCIIGGVVYRGASHPDLYGAYIYGDYVSGNIWALHHSGGTIITNQLLLTDAGVSAFGVDPRNGDVLYASLNNNSIKRIVPASTSGAPLPPTLADTGAFTNLMSLTSPQDSLEPAPGIVPYDINVPFWSDNAIKSRWVSLPDVSQTIGFSPDSNWSFPTGTVWIKNFNLELTNGDPSSTIRLETRFIVRNADGVYGVTYRWDGSQTNATLVPAEGTNDWFVINDGGIIRTQLWHYPSRAECLDCHTPAGGFGLGFNTPQLNHEYDYGDGSGPTNELLALSHAGYFSSPVTNDVHTLLALATATNTAYSLEFRTRSFLQANCSQCHQPQGTAQQSYWDARITTPTALSGLINGALVNNLGDSSNRVISPADPSHSVLLTRDAIRDGFGGGAIQMPPIDSVLTDVDATNVETQWILSMTNQFWIGASPDPQTVVPGDQAVYAITFVPTPDFAGNVALSVSNLPSGAGFNFTPSTVNSATTNSTLTITTSGSTPDGTYSLTVIGIGGGVTNSDTMALDVVSNIIYANPGTLLWNNSGGDGHWLTSLNWTNISAGGYGPPSTNNDVIFNNAAAGVTNTVNYSAVINSLTYEQTNGVHYTQIPAGVAVTIHGTAANYGLVGGTPGTPNVLVVSSNVISGHGAINIDNAGDIEVEQGAAQVDAHDAVLNLSGLDTLTMNGASQGFIAVGGGGYNGTSRTRASGTLYLAKTNLIYMKYNFRIGDNDTANSPNLCAIYLGQTNSILLGNNNDDFSTGFSGNTNLLAFAPGLTSPVLYVRSEYSGTAPRVPTWIIGNAGRLPCVATNDFSGGVIDVMANDLRLGRAASGANPAVGVLTFDGGTFDANTVEDGWQTVSAGGLGVGIINVNSNSASGTFGLFVVNNSLTLGDLSGTLTSGTAGTLNVNGGTALVNSIVAGGGDALISLNGGTLTITNSAGTPGAPLTIFGADNATIHLQLNSSAIITNIVTSSLLAGGVNTISIDSVANVSGPVTFPLISYSSFTGSVANFAIGALPAGYSASLVDNSAQRRIDLVIAASSKVVPHIGAVASSGNSFIFSGTNGLPKGMYYVLTSTNVATPLNQWTPVATNPFDAGGNFNFTNPISTNTQLFYLLQMP